jgi:hypothetical protein
MIERPRRVVLLIDYDNLQICAARDTPGRDLQLTPVVQLAQRYGTVIMSRAYAEWNLSTERLAVYKAGIEPAFAPVLRTESDRSGKSLADTVMVAEGMDMLWTLSPEVVVLATSDKDLIPLVRVAKQRGAFVVVLGSDFTAIPLREMADEHVTYRQLVTDASGRFATEAGPARQPAALPEPSRRRVRERSGRERTTTGSAVPTSTAVASTVPPRADRSERTERTERAEREAPVTAPSTAPSTSEPVAPVTGGLAGESDAQAGVRRRRRRGSRRRSDRLGQSSDGAPGENGAGEPFGSDMSDEDDVEITPTTSITEVAQASSGTVEAPPESEVETPEVSITETPEKPAAAPRDRRRRTRRPAAGADLVGTASASEDAPRAEPSPEVAAVVSPPEPEAAADLPSAGEESGPTEPSPNGEEPAAPPTRTRSRRVASARAGRSRSSGR